MRSRERLTSRLRNALDRLGNRVAPHALSAAIGGLALSLRLYGLGDKPFWMDEITSLHRATATVPHLVGDSLHQNHYPTYFLLLWLVARIGTSQWLLRLPSAIFGAACASLVCMIGDQAAGRRSGAIAGLLVAVSPFEVQLGQEARSYTLASCLILTALFGLVRLAQQPDLAALPLRRGTAMRSAWLAYGLGTAMALVVLNVAVPWLLASNLGALAIAARDRATRCAFLRNWGVAQLCILSIWLPMLAAVYIGSGGGVLYGPDWAPAETIATVWGTVAPVYLLRISSFMTLDVAPAPVPALSVAIAALAAVGAWRLRRDPAVLVTLGLAAFLLPAGLLLLSVRVPVLVPRYFAWGAGPFLVLAGAGLGQFSGIRFAATASMLGVAGLVNLAPYYHYETKPRWDLLAARMATKARPGDVVLVNNYYSYYVFSAFAVRNGLADRGIKLAWKLPEAVRLASGHDLWVVYGRAGQARMRPLESYRASLTGLGRAAAEFSVGRYIVAWRYRQPSVGRELGAQAVIPQACSKSCGADEAHP
jgi:mannosyltransferase